MSAERAEWIVRTTMWVLAATFAVVGVLFIATPAGVVGRVDDVGDWLGGFSPAPGTGVRLWLALGFAYMTVITGIALLVSTDVARYRHALLALAAGKAASSLAAGFYFAFDHDVFIYLVNFVVDGTLVVIVLWCWSLAGRVEPRAPGRRSAPGLRAREAEILRAFAQAQVPPGRSLPGAETDGGVDVIGPAQKVLAAAPARTLLAARGGLRLLQWTSFPRRFTSLSLERRIEHLGRLENGRVAVLRDLTLLCKTITAVSYARNPAVLEALGARGGCEPARPGGARDTGRPPPLDPAAMVAPGDVERCDAVIVGSGAGGASAARTLAEAGLDVIVVEQGGYHDAAGYPADPVDALTLLYRDAGLTICEGRPAIPVPVGRCVGGTTVINSGTCLRPPREVLDRWRDEHGIPWATDLDGHLDAVERALGVTDVELASAGRNARLCHAGAEAIGAANGPLRRNAPVLRRCGTCPSGCRIDAKRAMHVGELPRAAQAGARLRANAQVHEVLVRHGRAAGVACRLADGGRYEVRAPIVILAAGALGTPELLLRQGIANRSGAVGRHLRIHPACWVGARFDEPVRGWDGVMQSWKVDEWQDRGLFLEATFTPPSFGAPWLRGVGDEYGERLAAYDHLAVIGVHLADRSEGRVRVRGGSLRLSYDLSGDDAAALRFGIARAADVHFAAGAREVYPQIGGVPPLEPGRQAALVEHARIRPADLRLEGFHPMGTTRMGTDPRACVVGPTGESHDLPGLHVADTGIFPTSLRVNPMVTVMACARHIASEIAARAG